MTVNTSETLGRTIDQILIGEACWLWTGSSAVSRDKKGHIKGGYGQIWNGVRMAQAHRVMYEAFVGQIPSGLQLDHKCRVRLCVRPSHLEPVTNRENTLRGAHPLAVIARSGVCKRGHDLNKTRTFRTNGWSRGCSACRGLEASAQ